MPSLLPRLDDSPRGKIVKLLQKNGPLGIKELRHELNLSDTAVRQQLLALLAEGLIQTSTHASKGVGRPSRVYELAPAANDLFACYCEDLALNLYNELLADQGPEVVRRLLDRVGAKLAQQYQQQVRGRALQERVHSFAGLLDGKGILSDISQDAGVIMLHEFNCPYHELAAVHREICEMEQGMIAQVLDAEVELTNCIMDGHHNCSFVVRPRPLPALA